jgi:hypothetical protein
MPSPNRIAGFISVQVDGEVHNAEGDFEYNLGAPKRETLVGTDGTHGFAEKPQEAFISGTIRDRRDLDLQKLFNLDAATITLSLANGKLIVFKEAWFSGEGTANTGDAKVPVRFSGKSAVEVR